MTKKVTVTKSAAYTEAEHLALQVSACAKHGYTDIRFNDDGSVDVQVSGKWTQAFTSESARTFLDSADGKSLTANSDQISALFSLFDMVDSHKYATV